MRNVHAAPRPAKEDALPMDWMTLLAGAGFLGVATIYAVGEYGRALALVASVAN